MAVVRSVLRFKFVMALLRLKEIKATKAKATKVIKDTKAWVTKVTKDIRAPRATASTTCRVAAGTTGR